MVIYDEDMGLYVSTDNSDASESAETSAPVKTREPAMFLVWVPARGKWMCSDPDEEDTISLNKNFYSAFEFKTFAHAQRAQTQLDIDLGLDAHIFGDMYAAD